MKSQAIRCLQHLDNFWPPNNFKNFKELLSSFQCQSGSGTVKLEVNIFWEVGILLKLIKNTVYYWTVKKWGLYLMRGAFQWSEVVHNSPFPENASVSWKYKCRSSCRKIMFIFTPDISDFGQLINFSSIKQSCFNI